MRHSISILFAFALVAAGCSMSAPAEVGAAAAALAVASNDDFEPALREQPTVLQVELHDFTTRSWDPASAPPAIRVGVDLGNVTTALPGEAKPRFEAVRTALRSGVGLIRVATGRPLDANVVDESGYSVHTVDGAELRDGLGSPRQALGFSVVPGPLDEGWYLAYVDVTNAVRAGMRPLSEQRSFVNGRRGNLLFARFYVGARSVWRRTTVTCGPAKAFGEKLLGWERACLFAPHFTAPPASADLAVTYGGLPAKCVVPTPSAGGRRLRGVVCPEPAPGAVVSIAYVGRGAVDPTTGKPPEAMTFGYEPANGKLFVPKPASPELAMASLAPHEQFALELLP